MSQCWAILKFQKIPFRRNTKAITNSDSDAELLGIRVNNTYIQTTNNFPFLPALLALSAPDDPDTF